MSTGSLPRLSYGVQWCFEPTQVTFLEIIIEADDGNVTIRPSPQVNVDSFMATKIAPRDGNAFRLVMGKCL